MPRHRYYYFYVIQIGTNSDVLQVGYCTDIDHTFSEFLHSHPQIRDSILRPDLYRHYHPVKNYHQAKLRCAELVRELEGKGYEVIAGPTLMNDYWQVYIIELNGDPNHVYVGQTNYPIELRLQQHIYKLHPARALLKTDIFELAYELCEGLPKYKSQADSEAGEKATAARLKRLGYRVEGGT